MTALIASREDNMSCYGNACFEAGELYLKIGELLVANAAKATDIELKRQWSMVAGLLLEQGGKILANAYDCVDFLDNIVLPISNYSL